MIRMVLNSEEFSQDIYALIKAFYPGHVIEQIFDGAGPYLELFNSELKSLRLIDIPELDGVQERKLRKSLVKRKVYQLLQRSTWKELPWGTLTGIRPVKIPMAMLEDGKSEEEIQNYLNKEYFVSHEKIELSLEIARRERQILAKLDYEKGYSLYVGIPFCPSTCLYCSFTSYPLSAWKERVDQYLEAVFKEIDFLAQECCHLKLNTIYIGGGTPTTLSPDQLDRLLTRLEETLPMEDLLEFTVEAGRPDSITEVKLRVLKRHQVSRISINPQTMNQETLDLIGRRHSAVQIRETYRMARNLGFENINMDLIMGLPGEGFDDMLFTLEEIKRLAPDSLTIHALAIKRAAALNQLVKAQGQIDSEGTREIMAQIGSTARALDLVPYYLYRQKNMAGNFENVGYAKVDKAGIYNILIMEEKQTIMAVGAGASSKFLIREENRIERTENVKDVGLYIERIDEMIQRKRTCMIENKLTKREES